jgi:hypothetical protein
MKAERLIIVLGLVLALIFIAPASWALDADEDEDAAQDTTSETEDDAAGSDGKFAPPHDEHTNSTPVHPDHESGGSAADGASMAEAASDPSSILTQFQNFFWTTGTSDDNNIANIYLNQMVLPLSKSNVFRPALPLINTAGKTGIGDLFLLDLEFVPLKSGTFGYGAAASVPIGADEFSTNKWELGPSVVYINKTNKWGIWGVLGYNLWDVAGKSSASDVNILNFQPIVVVHTSWGYWAWTDQIATLDWEHDNKLTFPLGLRFGRVFPGKTPIKSEIGFYYNLINNNSENTFGVKFTYSLVKPHMLNH